MFYNPQAQSPLLSLLVLSGGLAGGADAAPINRPINNGQLDSGAGAVAGRLNPDGTVSGVAGDSLRLRGGTRAVRKGSIRHMYLADTGAAFEARVHGQFDVYVNSVLKGSAEFELTADEGGKPVSKRLKTDKKVTFKRDDLIEVIWTPSTTGLANSNTDAQLTVQVDR